MSDPEWWRPERLARLEAEFRERPNDDRDNDFGSYHVVASGRPVSESALHLHNDLDPGPKIATIRRSIDLGRPTSILDVGCGKGFLLYDFTQSVPGVEVAGIDVSTYALEHAKDEMKPFLREASAAALP